MIKYIVFGQAGPHHPTTPRSPRPAGALLLCLALLTLLQPAAGARLEQWDASMSLRLRLFGDGVAGELQQLRASGLLRLDRHLTLWADVSRYDGVTTVPELQLRYENGSSRLALGRFYLPLGVHDYSELYYVGFVFVPLLKYYPLRGFLSYRPESGVLWSARRGDWSWELALVGEEGTRGTLGLQRPRGVAGRAQTSLGRLILGLNGYTAEERIRDQPQTIHFYGLDVRFSVPQWVVRAEAFRGSVEGEPIKSYYVDLLHHPRALPRWTFLTRLEGQSGRFHHARSTIGARRVLRRGLTLSLNWVDDRVHFPSDAGGVNVQLQRTLQY